MSKQVRLVTLQCSNLDMLKKAVAEQGYRITNYMKTYGGTYNEGVAYGRDTIMICGIDTGGKSNMGIAQNTKTGTFSLVGESYDAYGLEQISSEITQRYSIIETQAAFESTGWEIVSIPAKLLKHNSTEKLELRAQPKKTIAIGMMA